MQNAVGLLWIKEGLSSTTNFFSSDNPVGLELEQGRFILAFNVYALFCWSSKVKEID